MKVAYGVLAISLLNVIYVESGYLLGDPGAECWLTDLTTQISTYQTLGCPSTISLTWIDSGPASFTENSPQRMLYELSTTLSVVPNMNHNEIRHSNLHSCLSSIGSCTPILSITPGLVSQTSVMGGNFTDGRKTFSDVLILSEGMWTVIAHSRFVSGTTQFDIAIGTRKNVLRASEELEIPVSSLEGLIAFSVFCIIFCLITLAILVRNRRRKIIRYSSPPFCMVTLVGCALGASGSIPFGFVTEVSCMLRPSFLTVAFTMTFIPLILKTYRIYKLFAGGKIVLLTVTDKALGKILAVFVFIDIVILTCWFSEPNTRPRPAHVIAYDGVHGHEYRCVSKYNDAMAISVLLYKFCILLVGFLLAYLARNAPSLFNESAHIVRVLRAFVGAVVVGSALVVNIRNQPAIVFAIQTFVICFISMITAIQIFAPKFYLLYTVRDEEIQGFGEVSTHSDMEMSFKKGKSIKISPDNIGMLAHGGRPRQAISPHEIQIFSKDGAIPMPLTENLLKLKEESTLIVSRSGAGFRIISSDFDNLKSSLSKLTDILSCLETHGVASAMERFTEEFT